MKKSIILAVLIISAGALALSGCATDTNCSDTGYGGTVEGGNNTATAGAGSGGNTSGL
jgi:hypothetical protein